jgi:glycosyltransferase involved in cell wall biosynthesis
MGPVFGFFGTMQKSNWINRSVEVFESLHRKGKYDIVLAQSSTGLGVIRKKRDLDIKVISIAHGSIVSEYRTFLATARLPKDALLIVKNAGFTLKNFFRRQRDFVHGSDRVIAVSHYVKKALIDETFTFENKINVIHNGIDKNLFYSQENLSERGKRALYVGQVIRSKGIYDLLNIFKYEEMQKRSIDIVGGGDLSEVIKEEIKTDDNIKGKVNVVGKVPYSELIQSYFLNREYGVFILPTLRYEGLPMVLIEAMFSGLPVVAYDMGGVQDAVEDGETGYLVEPGNVELLKERVQQIQENSQLREQLSKNALLKAKKEFTLEKMLHGYEKLIEEVLA